METIKKNSILLLFLLTISISYAAIDFTPSGSGTSPAITPNLQEVTDVGASTDNTINSNVGDLKTNLVLEKNRGSLQEKPNIVLSGESGTSEGWYISQGSSGCFANYIKFGLTGGSDNPDTCGGFKFALSQTGVPQFPTAVGFNEKIGNAPRLSLSYLDFGFGASGTSWKFQQENNLEWDIYNFFDGSYRNREAIDLIPVGINAYRWIFNNNGQVEMNNNNVTFGNSDEVNMYYDGSQLVIDSSGATNSTVFFSDDISATGFITRTFKTNLTDKEAYNLVKYALQNEYDAQDNYNHQAWDICYTPQYVEDKSKPIYKTKSIQSIRQVGEKYLATVNGTDITEPIFEEFTEQIQVITGYEKKIVGGVNIDCKQVMISKAQNHLTKEFDGGIAMFDAIYTKSKYPQPNVNYASDFKIEELNKKSTHYATTNVNGKEVTGVEERLVHLEGAMAQIVSETCLDNKKYSWCKK